MALGAALLGAWPAAMAAAQAPEVQPTIVDPGSTQPVGIEPVTEPAPEPAPEPAAEPTVEPTSRPLFTESRKILAIIGGLVFVAFALALLTVRYWRMTKPIPAAVGSPSADGAPAPVDPSSFDPADAPLFVGDLDPPLAPITTEVPSVAAADHRPDTTWEPRGTGEHAAIQVAAAAASGSSPHGSAPSIARPGRAARAAALAVPTPAGEGPERSTASDDPAGTDAVR
jgi:hypothetical protein